MEIRKEKNIKRSLEFRAKIKNCVNYKCGKLFFHFCKVNYIRMLLRIRVVASYFLFFESKKYSEKFVNQIIRHIFTIRRITGS